MEQVVLERGIILVVHLVVFPVQMDATVIRLVTPGKQGAVLIQDMVMVVFIQWAFMKIQLIAMLRPPVVVGVEEIRHRLRVMVVEVKESLPNVEPAVAVSQSMA